MGTIATEKLFIGGTVREVYVEYEEVVNGKDVIIYREVLLSGKLGRELHSTVKTDLLHNHKV